MTDLKGNFASPNFFPEKNPPPNFVSHYFLLLELNFASRNFFGRPMRFPRNQMFGFRSKNIESGRYDDFQMGNIPKTHSI